MYVRSWDLATQGIVHIYVATMHAEPLLQQQQQQQQLNGGA